MFVEVPMEKFLDISALRGSDRFLAPINTPNPQNSIS